MLVSVLVLLLCGVASAVDGPKCDLPEALDTTLSFTTSGDADWFCQDVNSYDGVDAAKSGDISHNQQSSIQTTVSGAGTVSFYWKVSSETGSDYLEFYIDGLLLDQISGSVDWKMLTYTITATGSHTFEWRYVKDATIDSRDDCGWVDQVKWGPIVSTTACDLSEALDQTLNFITGGSADWFCQDRISFNGDAAQSGRILDNQVSRMQTMVTVSESSLLSFYWKVSSEPVYDYLEFYIDGNWQDEISGTMDWHKMVYIVPSGSHILEWRYVKGADGSEGYDSGWVDQLAWEPSFKPEPPCNLSDVLDTTLSFTTGGVSDWGCSYKTTYDGVDAAQSGEISDNEDSWMQTIVSGCGTISFFWKVSSEGSYDHLEFYIDGVVQDRISGLQVGWQQMTYEIITLGLHTLEWRYVKDHSDSFRDDCGWVDQVEWVAHQCGLPCDLPDALDTDTTLNFTTGGDADWFCQTTVSYFDGDAARSGHISHNQQSWLQTKVNGAGTVSFYWKVISHSGDNLEFYVDGLLLEKISGSVDWQKITYTITATDLHTLEWRYAKNATVSANTDSGWVDNVKWEPAIEALTPCDVSEALDTTFDFITGGIAVWFCQDANFFYDGDAAQSGDIADRQVSRILTTVTVDEQSKLTFYWKVSSEADYDFLQFYINGVWEDEISGDVDWHKIYYYIPAGTHILEWRYIKDAGGSEGDDCGWVDKVELLPEKPL